MDDFGLILDKEKTTEQMFKVCQYYDVKNVDLANLMFTTEVEISNWKTGKRFPEWDKIMFFAYVFNISLDELIIRKMSVKVRFFLLPNLVTRSKKSAYVLWETAGHIERYFI